MKKKAELATNVIVVMLLAIVSITLLIGLFSNTDLGKKLYCNSLYQIVKPISGNPDSSCEIKDELDLSFIEVSDKHYTTFRDGSEGIRLQFTDTDPQVVYIKIPKEGTVSGAKFRMTNIKP